eukprot:CAMPEP_0170519030 /NCGR_PEP_ID=MMETSP0209-20121228/4586_1 /TAXON_ID=665100 ORGANISM="Litonotus pictus, Strain P1" /NCGR_SAMPLE_ID=MMETSP0209 /ASSEMBLY_ACC=CAM_ASM_000301 /LENGTH=139 /DNA_ID=CAMNT_0010804809 /DNA_START=12 /DNA_END=431 /DNA_ORIENTATION=+
MPYIWNIYEKSFTPYFASLAPKHQVNRHIRNPGKNKLSIFWQDTRTKNIMRFFHRYVLQNSKGYVTLILGMAMFMEWYWKKVFRTIYLYKNTEHSLEYAERKEAENIAWRRKTFPEEFEDEEEDEEESGEGDGDEEEEE